MSLQRVKIKHDGSNYIACITYPAGKKKVSHGPKLVDAEYEQFKHFYGEALEKKITVKGIIEYIQERFVEIVEDVFDIPMPEIIEEYIKRYKTAVHKRLERCRRKAFLNEWNWFTTFTYDDKKMSRAEFERQIRTKLSDLSSHAGWNYMYRWEEGEIGGRKHIHAFLYVPEGKMVGELYQDRQFSKKRNKWDIFTNNTYFQERFGKSEWKDLSKFKNRKSFINYFTKYIIKNDGKLVYSRGIPDMIDAVIDTKEDVVVTYEKYDGEYVYAVLNPYIFSTYQARTAALKRSVELDKVKVSLSPIGS